MFFRLDEQLLLPDIPDIDNDTIIPVNYWKKYKLMKKFEVKKQKKQMNEIFEMLNQFE